MFKTYSGYKYIHKQRSKVFYIKAFKIITKSRSVTSEMLLKEFAECRDDATPQFIPKIILLVFCLHELHDSEYT